MPPEAFYLETGPFAIVPVCHYQAEYAWEAHQAFLAYQPTRVALELPNFLGPTFHQAVGRFPQLSILSYQVGVQTMIFPVEPTDAFAEATRCARQGRVPVHYVDLDVTNYQPPRQPVPDACSLAAIGAQAFYEQWKEKVGPSRAPHDQDREQHMVQRLRQLAEIYPGERWLVICGLAHAEAIHSGLSVPAGETREFVEEKAPDVTLLQPDLDTIRMMSQEMALVMSLYELNRGGEGPPETWKAAEVEEEPKPKPPSPLESMSSRDLMGSLESLLGLKKKKELPTEVKPVQLKAVHEYLNRLVEEPKALADLLGQLLHDRKSPDEFRLPQLPPPPEVKVFTFRQVQDRRDQLLPFYRGVIAQALDKQWDRQRILVGLVNQASAFYKDNTGEDIKPWQIDVFFRFGGNYAALKGRLLPGLFEICMAARGVADDNFGYEVWDLASFYPWCEADPDVPTIRMDADDLIMDGKRVQRWTLRRQVPRLRNRMQRLPFQKRAHEENAGEWGEKFKKGTMCSYPPEDIVIEDYGRYLQKKAISQISHEKSRVEPFSTSLLDGIDMRETLRNWHEKRIYVRETQKAHGGVGSVIVIFDEDQQERYPWKMSWHGEHSQESDMAFYATHLESKIVGPGIARCEYGGLMLTYPPGRLADVWRDPFYSQCQSKSEVLLMAGLDYCEEKHVVYVSAKPPRSHFRTLAARMGKKIVYVPIGALSPPSLKKIRVFHVLSSNRLRDIAKNYIW